MNDVIESGLSSQVKTVIYRCHDFYIYNLEKIRKAFPGNEIINITSKDYSILSEYRVIAITGPTTAAVEAMQAGSVVLWAPWVWDESIIIDDLMRNTGLLSQDITQLTLLAKDLINNIEIYNNQLGKNQFFVNQYLKAKLTISDQIERINAYNLEYQL